MPHQQSSTTMQVNPIPKIVAPAQRTGHPVQTKKLGFHRTDDSNFT